MTSTRGIFGSVPVRTLRRSLFVAALAVFGGATLARAATFTVTNTNDAGGGSLRDAITQANGSAGLDDIVFQAGLNGVIALGSDLPDITDDVTITGPGPRLLSVSGGNARRVLSVTASNCSVAGVRFANGFTDLGGGIRFNGAGALTVSDCHFDQNLSTVNGGAILVEQGNLIAERSTFTTCQSAGFGGVISYGHGATTGTATMTNCTFVNNFASNRGGAISQGPTSAYTSTITNCTFVVNNAGNGGGAIAVQAGSMTLLNSLFSANAAGGNPGGHIFEDGGTFISQGHNLFGHLDGTTFVPDPTDRFGTVASQLNTGILIAFPFNNGGLTDTLPPVNNSSILIDGGGAAGAPVADQRGLPRVGCSPDVGAFEVQTVTDTDGDGVINCLDTCPGTPSCASVNETGCPTDGDADGVFDGCDLCPNTLAGDTVDASGCSTIDEDADGVNNDMDLCRGTPACAIAGVDANGCPADADADGLFDGCDNCPGANDLTDTDADGIPDCLDPCPAVGDSDTDGIQDCEDGCPMDMLKIAPGACGCGQPETDGDTDGVPDCVDGCPADTTKLDPGACGCGQPDADTDGDGIVDCNDACAATPACAVVNVTGCPIDSDADGVADGCDLCPNTAAGDAVDATGCATGDEDNDGVANDADLCRGTPACAVGSVDANGCPADADADGLFDGCDRCAGTNDLTDTDGDQIPDCLDACPNVGDTDGDGVQDCDDNCPNDPAKRDPGTCGCGQADSDANADGIPDCLTLPTPDPAPQPTPGATTGIQPFLALSPVLPGGFVCGVGLAVPMSLMIGAFLIWGRTRRAKRRMR